MDRETEESICALQAQLYTQQIALRALARTHDNPVELLAAWRAALIEAATTNLALLAQDRNSDYLADQIRACSEEWTAELVELAVPAPGSLPT